MSIETQTLVETFEDLYRAVPLRPIRSDAEHDRAIARLNALIDRYPSLDEVDPAYRDVVDYLDVLGMIIERHETLIYGEPPAAPDGETEE